MAKIIIEKVERKAKLGVRELTLTTVSGDTKWDIREWKGDKFEDGARFTDEEMIQLISGILKGKGKIGNKELVLKDNTYALVLVHNGREYIRPFLNKDEADKLLEIVDEKNVIESLHNCNNDSKIKEEKPKTKGKIIMFQKPKDKPEIEKIVTEGNASYEDCVAKITKEKETYVDTDSQYVLDGVLELCKVDADFRNNVMRDDKNYEGAMKYMMDMCQKGFGYKMNNMGFMDRDMGLGFTIDYYNVKIEEPKKKETKTTAKKAPAKRGRKKKEA